MDQPPSPVLVSKLSRSLQARKRKQKSHVVKNKSSNHLDNVIEKIEDNNDIITNTVKEIENCLQLVKSTESQFTISDAEILNTNLDNRINTLHEIQNVIERENDILDISLAEQNNVLNYVQPSKSHKEERSKKTNSFNVRNVASTSKEKQNACTNVSTEVTQYSNSIIENQNLLSTKNSICVENDMLIDDCTSDQDLLDDGNDSRISNLVNTIISGTKVYSSTPVQEKFQKKSSSKLNTSYRPKSINISEDCLKSASKLFEDMFESPIIETSKAEFRKNVNKKSLNFTKSEMDENFSFHSDITDTQMNQIVDEVIVVPKTKKIVEDCFNGFESNSINNSQEAKENWDSHLHQWRREFLDLSENSKLDFKGFHKVDNCHKILDKLNLEIERLKNTFPKIQSNKLKRFQQDELISDKFIKKYRYDSCNDTSTSKDKNVFDLEFHSASNKPIEIKNTDLSKVKIFDDLDDYRILLSDDTKLSKKASKIPLKSDSNIGRKFEEVLKNPKISEPSFCTSPSEFSKQKIKSKLSRMEKHELTLQNLAEMEKSFKAAENVFAFNADSNYKNKKTDTSKAFFELHESFNTSGKNKGDALYESLDEESKIFSMKANNLGFQAAFNKQVNFNDNNSLRKVQILCKDVVESNSDSESSSKKKLLSESNVNEEICFRTASNKKCKINEDVLRNVDILFKDINEFSTDNTESNSSSKTTHTSSKIGTSSNNSLNFEKRTVKSNKSLSTFLPDKDNTFENSQNFGFQTASHKAIKTNDKSLKTAQMLFKDLESNDTIAVSNDSRENDIMKNSIKKSEACSNFGFSTASNKKLEAKNEKALEKAENLFKDLDADINAYEGPKRNSAKQITSCNIIKTDEKSLEIAKNLFKDIENDGTTNITSKKTSISASDKENSNLFKKPSCNNFGFATASNKTLEVLKENALEKAENLFKDIDENINSREGSMGNLEKQPKLPSISGNIKTDSMSKACNLFKDIFEEFSDIASDKNEFELNTNLTNLGKPSANDKNVKQNINYGTNYKENKEIYDELENAVMCFENMDETFKIPASHEIEKINPQLENKEMEQLLENDNEQFLDMNENQTEEMDNMSSKFSTEDKKSEYSDLDETLIEDTDDFTDAGSVGSKSDLDNVVLWKDIINSKQFDFNMGEIKPGLGAILSKQNYLNEPCISLRQPNSSDLKQLDTEVKRQITDLNMLISLLEKKKTHIKNLMNCDSKNQSVSFTPGKLYKEKQKNRDRRIPLKAAVNNHLPCCMNDLPSSTVRRFSINLWDITPENACDLHFYLPSPPSSFIITLTDDAKLMPSSLNLAGLAEFKIAFETMPGVDKQKVIVGWFENHFRWIVWKLASMDRQFPNQFDGYFLTPNNIMQQLKYRYDRDVYGNERSAIRKIVERDDVPSRRMVLYVSKIVESSGNNYEIELCDGWYSMKANIDLCLLNFVRRKKIQVGTKLMTYGAELINVSHPCHPLQVQSDARLKIHGNSTRRVKWDTKLGFQKITGPFRTSVHSILPSGGYVGRVLGFIARSFPLKYIEKMSNEQWVCRCKRAEARRDRTFQTEQEKIIEKAQQEAYETLQNQWHEESISIIKENKNSSDIQKLTCPKKLLALLEFSTDPSSISELLSKSQLQIVTDYRSKLNSQRQADISSKVQNILNKRGFAKRTVSSVLQIIIVDAHKPNLKNHFMVEIWNPDNYIIDNLTEYATVDFLNLMSSNARSDNSLKATKQTRYLRINQQTNMNRVCLRYYTPIRQMQLVEYNPPIRYCDTVGVIVKICSEDNLIRYVWLADAHFRLLRVVYKMDSNNCLAFEGFNVGDIVAVFNLKLSKSLLGQAQALIDYVTYVTKTPSKSPDMTAAIEYLHNELPSSFNDFICDCDDKIAQWNSEMSLR